MSAARGEGTSAYQASGVDYEALDAGKRHALTEALATSSMLAARGGKAIDASRGEPAFAFELGGQTFGFVLEGLGTKSMIAAALQKEVPEGFRNVAYDTVAAIVNDLACVGALPLVVNAYFATGSSDWYETASRRSALLDGWRAACEDAGATWGGGESPTLPELVSASHIELAGSAIGTVPNGRKAIVGQELTDGDEIVFVASTGMHANGSSLARLLADDVLPEGYATKLPSGRSFGEALLEPAPIYVPLIAALLEQDVPVHYLSHITGHGMLKLMRPSRDFTYLITELPEVPEVLSFMAEHSDMAADAAYSTFNMGCGFAIYCAKGAGEDVVDIAKIVGLDAHVAGIVKAGQRRVILEPLGVTYESGAMDLTPRRAA